VPLELFKREYIHACRFQHPLFRKYYSFQTAWMIDDAPSADPEHFYVAEFYPGSLKDEEPIRAQPAGLERAAQVRHGWSFLASQGWYNGDLRSGNVLVAADGLVKLADLSPFFSRSVGLAWEGETGFTDERMGTEKSVDNRGSFINAMTIMFSMESGGFFL
jgi:serine/threonine protein kinase